jgi:hypothetical protein
MIERFAKRLLLKEKVCVRVCVCAIEKGNMVTDEKLKKLKEYAWKVINEDERRGVTVTVAMDPVTLYLMAMELLMRRKKENWSLSVVGLNDE